MNQNEDYNGIAYHTSKYPVPVCIFVLNVVWSRRGHDRMVVGFKLPMQSVPITTNVVRSNPTQARCSRNNIM